MKLEIELVPESSWYSNMRKEMTVEKWDTLRKQIYRKYNYCCGICGDTGMMNCHEIWEYDDVAYTQYLRGFIALCTMCHHCKHIGLAGILADEGKLDYSDVENHFRRVNGCTQEQMDKAVRDAFEIWDRRSNHSWTINLGEFSSLI